LRIDQPTENPSFVRTLMAAPIPDEVGDGGS